MKQNLMRFLLLLLLFSSSVQKVFANEINEYYFLVWNVNGEVTMFSLKEEPKVTYYENFFKITTLSEEIMFGEDNISQFTLSTHDEFSSINEIDKNRNSVMWNDNILKLRSFIPNTEITIYSITGQKVYEASTDIYGALEVDLSAYQHQIFIVRTNDLTFKILKK